MRRVLPIALWICSCSEPSAALPPPVANLTIAGVAHAPVRDDGKVSPIVRTTIELSSAISDARVLVIAGGANDNDVIALAKNRATTALRAREIPSASWIRDRRVFVQPSRALPAGRSTIVVLPEQRAALSIELDVAEGEIAFARRMWTDGKSVTHCADKLPEALDETIELAPTHSIARVVRHRNVPCFDVIGAVTNAVLPPAFGGIFIDPATIAPPDPPPVRGEPPCPEDAYPLPPLCVRVDDDRIVIVGAAETKRLLLGRWGLFETVATVIPGARHVVRGFPPLTPVSIDLLVRDALGDHRVAQTLTTRPRRRHVVINEVLARPASGATTQRFVELVNDGDEPVELAGLLFRDGDDEWELPSAILPPGAFALITAEGFVDGLAGEAAPPKGIERIFVERLRLTATLAITEPSGAVLSQFPPTTSTRTVARGRRATDTPDDAPNAFGWDARNSATPGRANAIAQP
jgi:hypothetical protein